MKTIIFDLGNVIAFFDHFRTIERVMPFSPFSPHEMYASVYAGTLEEQFERGLMAPAAFLQAVHRAWQLRCDIDFLSHAFGNIFHANTETCDLIPKLKGRYRLVLGSNTNAIHARRFLTQFSGVLAQFDSLVLSHEVGTRKPDAEFFQCCLRRANARADECVFIDDLAANIEGATAIGFHGIVYRPGDGLAEKLRSLGVEV
jgi:putative hydrolase of the HAD superfamily